MILLYLDILDGNFVAGDWYDTQSRGSVRTVTNSSFLLSNLSIEGFLFDSLIGRFPVGSRIYIFGRLLRSVKLLIIRWIRRYMTTVVYLITVWRLYYRGGSRTWRRKEEPRRDHPQGLSGILATSRASKGGGIDGVRGGRNRLATRGCRGREGPGEQFEVGKTSSSVREVEAGRSGYLSRWTGDPRPEEKGDNWVLKERCNSVYGWRDLWRARSEERSGGKDCRTRWATYQ